MKTAVLEGRCPRVRCTILFMVRKGPIDLCMMCRKVKELQDSHLLPASVYKKLRSRHLRDPYNPNRDPIEVTAGKARQTSRQTTDYLLCTACEGILDRGGEKHVLPLLANEFGFPFHDLLTGIPPDIAELDYKAYACARIPSLDCEKITHFAAGIFWKAAIHSWVLQGSTVKIDLQGYEEGLREYLLGANPFPDDVTLILRVVPPGLPSLSAVAPRQVRDPELDMFCFYVPGIDFSLFIGRTLPEFQIGCFARNPNHPVFVDPTVALTLGKLYHESFVTAKLSARLAASLEKRRRQRDV
jgi:hypothetical protein